MGGGGGGGGYGGMTDGGKGDNLKTNACMLILCVLMSVGSAEYEMSAPRTQLRMGALRPHCRLSARKGALRPDCYQYGPRG